MTRTKVALFVAREVLRWLSFTSLFAAAWWLSTSPGPFGPSDHETARRVIGVLIGVWLIATGNQLPKGRLVPASNENSALLQRFQRVLGWQSVVSGVVFALFYLALPVDAAFNLTNFVGGLMFFAAMLLGVHRRRPRDPVIGVAPTK